MPDKLLGLYIAATVRNASASNTCSLQCLCQLRAHAYLSQSLNQLVLFVQAKGDSCPAHHLQGEEEAELAGHSGSQDGAWHIPQGYVGSRVQLSTAAVRHIAAIPNAVEIKSAIRADSCVMEHTSATGPWAGKANQDA